MKNYQKHLQAGKAYTVNGTHSWVFLGKTADGYHFELSDIEGVYLKVDNTTIKVLDFALRVNIRD